MIFSQLKEFKTWDFDIENWEFASFWWLTQVYTRPIFLIQNNEIYRELTLYYSLYSWLFSTKHNFSDKGVTIGTWCNGYGDFLQVDHKTMVDYSDIGSKQTRFCGSSTCK